MLKKEVSQLNNLKIARQQAGKSQMQAAMRLETTQHQISKWENEKQDITLSKATILADYYCVSLDYLAGRTNEPKNPNL